jgi:hypothetical protein
MSEKMDAFGQDDIIEVLEPTGCARALENPLKVTTISNPIKTSFFLRFILSRVSQPKK